MIVGEAPGREEIKQGIPFCGRSGLLLDDALHKAGTHRVNVYVTNCFKGDVGEGNRNPTFEELEEHKFLLMAELFKVEPKRILLLGAIATNRFLPNTRTVKNRVGNSYLVPNEPAELFPCYHPAYVLRGHRIDIVNSFYSVVNNFVNSNYT